MISGLNSIFTNCGFSSAGYICGH